MNLNLQDLIAILGPMITLVGFMWYHFNSRFDATDKKIDNLRLELKEDINRVEGKLGEKMDAVRDRVSRIEGQLVPTKIIAFEESRETRPIEMKEHKSARR